MAMYVPFRTNVTKIFLKNLSKIMEVLDLKKLIVLGIIIILSLALFGCGGNKASEVIMDEPVPSGAGDARHIELEFDPDTIIPNEVTIKAGEKILWVLTNTDDEEDHNFIEYEAGIDEILVVPGQTVRRLWTATNTPGTYEPYCAIHPWIRMTLIVE